MSHGSDIASNGSGGYETFDPASSFGRNPQRPRNASTYSVGGGGGGGFGSRTRSNTTLAYDPGDRFDDLDNGSVRSTDNVPTFNAQQQGPNRFLQSDENDTEDFNPGQFTYQDLIHSSAMARLETELRDFVRSRPLSKWSEYDGNGGGYQAGGKFPLSKKSQSGNGGGEEDGSANTSAPLAPDRNYFVERPAKESAERIYSRSSVQRYILQRLAAELNGHQEIAREFHSYEAFKKALSVPESTKLDLIKPNVVERKIEETGGFAGPAGSNTAPSAGTMRNPSQFGSFKGRSITGSPLTLSHTEGKNVGETSTNAPSPLTPGKASTYQSPHGEVQANDLDDPSSQPVYRYGTQSYHRNQERLRWQQQRLQYQQSPIGRESQRMFELLSGNGNTNVPLSNSPPSGAVSFHGQQRKAFLNMYSFPNVETDTFYVYR